ncbi:hypothetical protein [Halocynthiibacter namhaensis]|uniref:hypothetical protein n=1 Tax=Halocynthiibacter namhaensis TaxID=1290553 RepID=UPI000578FB64|nr:hypothetical protein [Halocynthiibacter namhaensis]
MSRKNFRQGLYIDTPVLTSVSQIEPYYDYGIFDEKTTPILLRRRAIIDLQRTVTSWPKNIPLKMVRGGRRLPVQDGGIIFYPYNSQTNINMVAQRQFHHVLTLHGESNKAASQRPAARLYDYICVAGPLAIDRYITAGIFTRSDVENGRLIMMGDSFVQHLPWICTAQNQQNGALLYSPTWEGYGHSSNNYTSVSGQYGFKIAAQIAHALNIDQIVIKPHPYLGLLKPRLLADFVSGVRHLRTQGFHLSLALKGGSSPLLAALRIALPKIHRHEMDPDHPLTVRFGLSDVSGMEAIYLSAGIPSFTIARPSQDASPTLKDIQHVKYLAPEHDLDRQLHRYLQHQDTLDAAHRNAVFGFQDPNLKTMTAPERMSWLQSYIQRDPHWRRPAMSRHCA